MRILGVDLQLPSRSDLNLVPLFVVAGLLIGAAIHTMVGGPTVFMKAMAVAGGAGALLAAAGANLDHGWRGAAVCLLGAIASFYVTVALGAAVTA